MSHGNSHHPSLTWHHLSRLTSSCHHLTLTWHLSSDHHLTSRHHLLLTWDLTRCHLSSLHLASLHLHLLHLLLGWRPHWHPKARPRWPHEPVLHLHGLTLTWGPHAWLGTALSVYRRHVTCKIKHLCHTSSKYVRCLKYLVNFFYL